MTGKALCCLRLNPHFLHFHICTRPILLGSGETNRKKKAKKNKKKKDSVHKDADIVTPMTDETEAVDLRQKPPGPTKPPRTHSTSASLILSSRDASVDRDGPEVPGHDDAEDEDGATGDATAGAEVREDKEAAVEEDQPRAGAGDKQAAAASRDADHVEVAHHAPKELGARPKVYGKKKTKKESDNANEVAESAVIVSKDSIGSMSKDGGGGGHDARKDKPVRKTEKESLNPLANKRKAKKERPVAETLEEEAQSSSKSTDKKNLDAAPRNPLAKKKGGEEKASLNPLAKKQEKAPLSKQMSGSRRGSEPVESGLPNFRMVRATVVQRQESKKSKKPRQAKMIVDQDGSRTFVDDSSSSEEEADVNEATLIDGNDSAGDVDLELPEFHLELFSMNPNIQSVRRKMMRNKQQKKRKADKNNPAMIKGLTAEEEKQLEEAKRAAEERARLREEERKEKVRKAEAEREAKLAEMSKKVESIERSRRMYS